MQFKVTEEESYLDATSARFAPAHLHSRKEVADSSDLVFSEEYGKKQFFAFLRLKANKS